MKYQKSFFGLLLVGLIFFVLTGCQPKTELISVDLSAESSTIAEVSTIDKQPDTNSTIKPTQDNNTIKSTSTNTEVITAEIPTKLILPVLFAQQAPFSNWNEVYQEACEEASMIMADRYFKNLPLNETIMKAEIDKLFDWQKTNNYKVDLTANETAKILGDYFDLSAEVSHQVSVERIKLELFKGNLVIVPVAGRELKNPNFKQPGPIYHMLVIKGYDGDNFITNEPGTRKGDGFKYPYQRLLEAVHDWDHQLAEGGMTDEEMARGERVMVIVKKI